VIRRTMIVMLISPLYGARSGISWMKGVRAAASVAPPYAPAKIPTRVIPIWMVERNGVGS
jgi:hypothetical protein